MRGLPRLHRGCHAPAEEAGSARGGLACPSGQSNAAPCHSARVSSPSHCTGQCSPGHRATCTASHSGSGPATTESCVSCTRVPSFHLAEIWVRLQRLVSRARVRGTRAKRPHAAPSQAPTTRSLSSSSRRTQRGGQVRFFAAAAYACGHLIDKDDGKLVLGGEVKQLLRHPVEEARPERHVAKVLSKVKSDAVNHDQLHLKRVRRLELGTRRWREQGADGREEARALSWPLAYVRCPFLCKCRAGGGGEPSAPGSCGACSSGCSPSACLLTCH